MKLKVQVWIHTQAPSTDAGDRLRVLLLKTKPSRGDFWQPVTGSVEKGEGLPDAALREATEETGLHFNGPPLDLGESFEYESRGKQVQEHVFALEAKVGGKKLPAIQLDAHEHDESRWVSPTDAYEMIRYPSNAQMLRLLLERL